MSQHAETKCPEGHPVKAIYQCPTCTAKEYRKRGERIRTATVREIAEALAKIGVPVIVLEPLPKDPERWANDNESALWALIGKEGESR